MKRTLAFLMAAMLALSTGLMTYATETDETPTVSGSDIAKTVSGSDALAAARRELEQRLIAGKTGQVDVSIGAAMILKSPVAFSVELRGPQNESMTGEIVIGGDGAEKARACFKGLAEGQYVLTVSAKGYATYSQTISVEKRAYSVNLMTGFVEGINYVSGTMHPGVLLIGDVNGDGITDEADRTALVDAVDSGMSNGDNGLNTDLNGDGVVGLVVLEYF